MPIFHGYGTSETVIPEPLVERTTRHRRERSGAALTERRYSIAHAISPVEIRDFAQCREAIATP